MAPEKPTFFNLVSGLLAPSSGRIAFNGENITRLSPERRVWRGMARTFQITEIFPEFTTRENIRTSVEIAAGYKFRPWISQRSAAKVRDRVDRLLAMGGLGDKTDRMVGELSHGY